MKKKTVVIIAVAVIAAIAVGAGVKMLVSGNGEKTEKVETSPLLEGAVSVLDEDSAAADADASAEQDAAAETVPGGEEKLDASGEMNESDGGTGGGLVSYTEGLFDGEKPANKTDESAAQTDETTSDIPTISFPYAIPDTDLVVEQISPYNGYFIEDGSDQSVSNITAIVLTNHGDDLDFAGIGISQEGRSLAFSASQIPAGATIIIQEQNGTSYSSGAYYTCTATVEEAEGFDLSEDRVRVEDNGDNSFLVANISEETIPEIKVYFKNYLPGEEVYVGGITYSVTLTDVEPETGADVTASHYDSEYSTIVEVVTEG